VVVALVVLIVVDQDQALWFVEPLDSSVGEQPAVVTLASEPSRAGQSLQRERDGWAPGADQHRQYLVGERQQDAYALAGDPAPALGEQPEQDQQPRVDAREVRGRL